MPVLTISIGSSDVPLQVEVMDLTMSEVHRGAVSVDEPWELALQTDKDYLIIAHYPSGQRHQQQVRFASEEAQDACELALPAAEAPAEKGLAWVVQTQPELLAPRRIKPYQMRSLWARIWGFDGGWKLLPWQQQQPLRRERLAQYQLHVEETIPRVFLQLGGPKMAWRMIALPPGPSTLLLTPKDLPLPEVLPIDFTIGFPHPVLNALVGALSRGDMSASAGLKSTMESQLAACMARKPGGPALAALACYCFLRLGDRDALADWPDQITAAAPWLPDGPILQAWQALYRDDTEAFAALLHGAMAMGRPLFTEGMKRLRDGLIMLQQTDLLESSKGPDEPWLNTYEALDLDAVTTTFLGRSPAHPGEVVTGHPESPDHVVFIHDLTPQDLQWMGLLPEIATLRLDDDGQTEDDNIHVTVTARGDFLVPESSVSEEFNGHLPATAPQAMVKRNLLEAMATPNATEANDNPPMAYAFRSLTTATAAVKGWRRARARSPEGMLEKERGVWQSWTDQHSQRSLEVLKKIARGEPFEGDD